MKTTQKLARMSIIVLAISLVGFSAFATPKESTSYIFWPNVEAWVSDGAHLYGFPSVEARVYELVDGDRHEVTLSDHMGDYLFDVFESGVAEFEPIDIQIDQTLVVSVDSSIAQQSDEYIDFFVQKTIDCLKSLDDADEAEDIADFFLDPAAGATTSAELMAIAAQYESIAAKMLGEFRSHRCTEVNNTFEPHAFHESQIQAAVRGILIGIEDIVHFSQADQYVTVLLFENLYLGASGFFAVNSIYLIKEALMTGMDTLSAFIDDYSGYSDGNYFDFYQQNRDTFSVQDFKEIGCSCVSTQCDNYDPEENSCPFCMAYYNPNFDLEACYDQGYIVFDSITLGNVTRSFFGGK